MRRALAANLLLVLFPSIAFAQFGFGAVEEFTLGISPQYPRPGSTITLSPQSTLLDLANSTMTVTVNGKQVYGGNAVATSVTLAPVGQATTITARLTSQGQTFTKTLTLRPGDVSLVIEPIATAPPLYAGKSPVPQSGSVRLVAVADFRTSATARLDPDTLSYSWKMGDATLLKDSGIGRNAVIVPAPLAYRNETITVAVKSPGGSLSGGDSVALISQAPSLRLYVKDPLQGILFDRALSGQYSFALSEATFVATPYAMPLAQGEPVLQWFLNGSAAQTGPTITLRPEGAGRGSAALSVTASAGIETALAALSLTFGESGSFFGL